MRSILLLTILTAAPADAWEFSPDPVCTLSHKAPEASLAVTYDPRLAEPYAITIMRREAWTQSAVFSMVFEGPFGLTISTDRQRFSQDGRTLTVTDHGFGNVLNGLEFNRTATALQGNTALPFSLDGAAPEVRAFRACTISPTV